MRSRSRAIFPTPVQLSAPNTHLAAAPAKLRLPIRFDPAFDPRRTEFLNPHGRAMGRSGRDIFQPAIQIPIRVCRCGRCENESSDSTGSLVLVDPKLRQVKNSGWTNEYERPVYFIELHGEFRCCWCQCEGGKVILIPHPLSSCMPEIYRYPEEAEVVGQVVGVAMRLGPS